MSSVGDNVIRGLIPVTQQQLQRFAPEPSNRLGFSVQRALGGVASFALDAAGSFAGIDPGYVDLINQQIMVQQQMQLVSMESNVEKSKHETMMAPIRNLRAA
jgi:hypothetical protein